MSKYRARAMDGMSKGEMREFAKKRVEERKRRKGVSSKRKAKKQNAFKQMFDGDSDTVQRMLKIRY